MLFLEKSFTATNSCNKMHTYNWKLDEKNHIFISSAHAPYKTTNYLQPNI